MILRDYYAILGVPRTANAATIRAAFHELAKRYHPDHAGPAGTRLFQDILEAYHALSDASRRAAYDRTLKPVESLRKRRAERIGSPAPPEPMTDPRRVPIRGRPISAPPVGEPVSVFRGFDTFRPSFEELRERLLRNFTGLGIRKGERVEALNLELVLSPEEAARGGIVPLAIPVFEACRACLGSGRDGWEPCMACQGEGVVERDLVGRIGVPPGVRSGRVIEVPVQGLGIINLVFRLHIRVSPTAAG